MGGCRHRRKGQKWRNNTFWTLANRKHSYFTTRLDFWKTEQMVVTSLKIKVERTWREYLLGTSSGLSTLPALRLSILPTTPSRETGATPSLDRGGDQAWQEKLGNTATTWGRRDSNPAWSESKPCMLFNTTRPAFRWAVSHEDGFRHLPRARVTDTD